ncbi:MAG: heparinase II/III family protein [Alphaproteobacteria bacterium]
MFENLFQKLKRRDAPAQMVQDIPIAERFLTLPPNLGNGLPRQGAKVLIRRFDYAGLSLELKEPLWDAASAVKEPAWRAALFGFVWLDDLAAHGGPVAANKARAMVIEWMNWTAKHSNYNDQDQDIWRADIRAQRIGRLLRRATFLFSFAPPPELRGKLLNHLSKESAYLIHDSQLTQQGAGLDPIRKTRSKIGAVLAAMCLDGHQQAMAGLLKELESQLDQILLADGMVASRSPRDQVGIAFDLVGLKLAFDHARHAVPAFVQLAIKRMIPVLRMLRHGDGGLALFHGSREGRKDVIDAAIVRANVLEKAPKLLPQGGFARLQAKQLCVLMDIGKPPEARLRSNFHASPLAIEVSHDANRILTNCGEIRMNNQAWQQAMKSTAAHSALTLAERNAIDLEHKDEHKNIAFQLEHERTDGNDGAIWFTAWHDGYKQKIGAIVTRKLYLSANGNELLGEERISETRAPIGFSLRFHLHPDVEVGFYGKSKVPLLKTKSGASWWLRIEGGTLALNDSVYLGGDAHVVPTKQLTLEGKTSDQQTIINWVLESAD